MQFDLTHARMKALAKTLRADLGASAPSYQKTLDLLARGLGYATYEAMKAEIEAAAGPAPSESAARPAAPQSVTVLHVHANDRPEVAANSGPLLLAATDRPAARAAFDSWLQAVGADRSEGDPKHQIMELPVFDRDSARSVGRHGQRLPVAPTGQPTNLFLRDMDPVMDGRRLYNRPTFYSCGICGGLHPADWNGDCRDDSNRFTPEQLDNKFGTFGWDEIDMPGAEEVPAVASFPHPLTQAPVTIFAVERDTPALLTYARDRMTRESDIRALVFRHDPDGEPTFSIQPITAEGPEDPEVVGGSMQAAVPPGAQQELARLLADTDSALETPLYLRVDRNIALVIEGLDPEQLPNPGTDEQLRIGVLTELRANSHDAVDEALLKVRSLISA